VPTRAPAGIAPSGDGVARSRSSPAGAATRTGASGSSVNCGSSGSLATRASWAPAAMSLNEVRRQRRSSRRSKRAVPSSGAGSSGRLQAMGSPSCDRSTEMQPGASAASVSNRAVAAASDWAVRPCHSTVPSDARAKSNRSSGECRLIHDPAHQMTARWRARVSAT
jgi:hypothetical protein